METFEPLSDTDIRQLLIRCSYDFCDLDHIPVWLVKKCQAELIKVIRNIVNTLLNVGVFLQFMEADLLKYRPVSHLSCLFL